MVARRDKDLLAGDFVAAVVLRLCLGPHEAQIGAAVRFGQVHRASPVAGNHLGQEFRLEIVRCVGVDRRVCAVGQALIHVEGHVGRHEGFHHGGVEHVRQTLTAVFGVTVEGGPAAFFHLVKGRFEPCRGTDHAVFKGAAFGVANRVQRGQNFRRNLACFFEHSRREIAVQLVVSSDILFRDLQQIVQDELDIFDRGGVAGHSAVFSSGGVEGCLMPPVPRVILPDAGGPIRSADGDRRWRFPARPFAVPSRPDVFGPLRRS